MYKIENPAYKFMKITVNQEAVDSAEFIFSVKECPVKFMGGVLNFMVARQARE